MGVAAAGAVGPAPDACESVALAWAVRAAPERCTSAELAGPPLAACRGSLFLLGSFRRLSLSASFARASEGTRGQRENLHPVYDAAWFFLQLQQTGKRLKFPLFGQCVVPFLSASAG